MTNSDDIKFGPLDSDPTSEQIKARASEIIADADKAAFDEWWPSYSRETSPTLIRHAMIAFLAGARHARRAKKSST